ncbi:MAG: UvrD-helicase domain-containing protein [Candidatus Micrarchaeota archaeon]|nr:UvrD-helicase domain-containing protein [Candidatus Micrarchaeota archaeon]
MNLANLDKEKIEILKHEDNTLVVANPGTGKTLILAYKYLSLIDKGLKPENILCLTFTTKARREMEERIIKILKENNKEIDYSCLNIYTFHAYALENIEEEELVSTDLLRYSIYKYLKENKILRYNDEYLIENVVPKMENLIRYLKTFGIKPEEINVKEVKKNIEKTQTISKEEIDKFTEYFVEIYKYYENIKRQRGIDYADMLLEFLELKNKPIYEYVLIDELQDINSLEAQIALSSAKKYFAVGDKKQAIFGFQGGSILNFEKFNWKGTKSFILKENFRSTEQILKYAKEYFIKKTAQQSHREELKELTNKRKPNGQLPLVYKVEKEDIPRAVSQLVEKLAKENPNKKIAILVRTNFQILKISKELERNKIEHSSTYYSSSQQAREEIITFLKALLTNDIQNIKNAMFTPFFPIALEDAFELSKLENEKALEKIFQKSPKFKELKNNVKNIKDLELVFEERIIPIAVSLGKEYLIAAQKIQNSFTDALRILENITLQEVINYLKSAEIETEAPETEKQIILSTIHKAKGREFDIVVYVPHKTRGASSFYDQIVESILKTKKIVIKEELEEENLRIDFVAFSRAIDQLFIVSDDAEEYYIEGLALVAEFELKENEKFEQIQRFKDAYKLFVNGDYERCKKILQKDRRWILDFIKEHFRELDTLSFSLLVDEPCSYLKYNILNISEYSESMEFGLSVHKLAKDILNNQKVDYPKEYEPYVNNICKIHNKIKESYPQLIATEKRIKIELEKIFPDIKTSIFFEGRIDAIFKKDNKYLIVDWKTDKTINNASEHRQQLEIYKTIFSISNKIEPENIKVAIGYLNLQPLVNIGRIDCLLDEKQPALSAIKTVGNKIKKILEWKENPNIFFEDLEKEKCEHELCCSVVEEYKKEIKNIKIKND